MKKLNRLLKNKKCIVFLDFEGTQFSHEMISFGAILCNINGNGKIRKYHKVFEVYVKSKNKIGKYVTNLTGITEEKLETDGISFLKAMEAFRKYCGVNFKRAAFATFGAHDMRIINQSIVYNVDAPVEICRHIQKNHIDLSEIISEFVKDDNSNPMSLVNYCRLFSVQENGPAHNAAVDAVNLAHLYESFIDNSELVLEEYKKVLKKMKHLPPPISRIIGKLVAGKDVSASDFEEELKEHIG
ncbi:MAG: exonuclease domain-containing protein [Erysipelotrichia bacterium]|jgi:DNA polymerase III epsilon subunit-like protein|nr:3'-5' exonuclease [Bacilli bacterium]NLB49678.1 exonuclease domain-containing protein [Erysipelotrichia bacterium]